MPKFKVTVEEHLVWTILVEADNEEKAKIAASNRLWLFWGKADRYLPDMSYQTKVSFGEAKEKTNG